MDGLFEDVPVTATATEGDEGATCTKRRAVLKVPGGEGAVDPEVINAAIKPSLATALRARILASLGYVVFNVPLADPLIEAMRAATTKLAETQRSMKDNQMGADDIRDKLGVPCIHAFMALVTALASASTLKDQLVDGEYQWMEDSCRVAEALQIGKNVGQQSEEAGDENKRNMSRERSSERVEPNGDVGFVLASETREDSVSARDDWCGSARGAGTSASSTPRQVEGEGLDEAVSTVGGLTDIMYGNKSKSAIARPVVAEASSAYPQACQERVDRYMVSISQASIEALRSFCGARQLSSSGTRAQLISCIRESLLVKFPMDLKLFV